MPRSPIPLPSPSELSIPLERGLTTALVYDGVRGGNRQETASDTVSAALILGHGAGAGQRSGFMVDFARALSALGVDVITFNFLYTEQGRKIPDRAPTLEACYRAVIETVYANVTSARHALFESAASPNSSKVGSTTFSVAMIGAGVPLGAKIAFQAWAWNAGKPASAAVGTSGSDGLRSGVAIA